MPDAEALPLTLSPMLATAGQLPTGPGWTFETKWDGIRGLVAITSDGDVSIRTRAGNDVTGQFPELASLRDAADGHTLLLDGEIIAFDTEGKPSFNRIQGRLGVTGFGATTRAQTIPVLYTVFDLLHLDGFSTRRLPLENRRALLDRLELGRGPTWHVSTLHDDGELLRQVTKEAGIEGVVAKRLDSPYLPGVRTKSWIKHRNVNEDTFVIGGWVPGDGRRSSSIGSLLIGVRIDDDADTLQWVGRVGTGFTDQELDRLKTFLGPIATESSPFDVDVQEPNATYVKPTYQALVEFLEYTPTGMLRAPSYKGLATPTPAQG